MPGREDWGRKHEGSDVVSLVIRESVVSGVSGPTVSSVGLVTEWGRPAWRWVPAQTPLTSKVVGVSPMILIPRYSRVHDQ